MNEKPMPEPGVTVPEVVDAELKRDDLPSKEPRQFGGKKK
jgi:hypothetical protein